MGIPQRKGPACVGWTDRPLQVRFGPDACSRHRHRMPPILGVDLSHRLLYARTLPKTTSVCRYTNNIDWLYGTTSRAVRAGCTEVRHLRRKGQINRTVAGYNRRF